MNADTDSQLEPETDRESERPSGPPESSLRVTATPEGAVACSLAVAVDVQRVEEAFRRAYRDLGRKVRVKGFRPGKAPRSVLQKLYAASVAAELEHTLVAETLGEAIEQSGIQPVGEPAIDSAPPVEGSDFTYTARVEVKPRFTLPATAGLPAIRPAVDVSDEEVAEQLEALQKRSAPLIEEPEGTGIEEGHIVTVDFVGRIDGKPFEGGSGKDVELEVGSGRFLPGFEDQLVGARTGEDVEVRVTFPERYGNRELAGREAVFGCHVVAVKRRQIPELDDEFAKDMGDFASLEELRLRIRGDLMEARERESKQVLRTSLMDALVERTEFEVPAGMVERQLEQQIQAARRRLEGQLPEEAVAQQLERWREQWRDRAERDVREMLILEAVAEAQGIEVDRSEVEARIAKMLGSTGADPAALRRACSDEGLVRAFRAQLVDEKALDFLVGEAKVEETTDT